MKYLEFDPRDYGTKMTNDIQHMDFNKLFDVIGGVPHKFEIGKIVLDSSLWYIKVLED